MIKVPRVKVVKGVTVKPNAAWDTLASNATAEAIREKDKHEAEASVYASQEVRKCLEEIFNLKCAYCEEVVTDGFDVDHYRPKGAIAGTKLPGYYWLAYKFENLYPSCECCNRSRKDYPTWTENSTGAAAGKFDQFPLIDETKRVTVVGASFDDEGPLLLDPCADDAVSYFSCNPFTGEMLALKDDPRAAATIKILNLNRKRLKDQRKKLALGLKRTIQESPNLVDCLFLEPDQRYSGFAKILSANVTLLGLTAAP